MDRWQNLVAWTHQSCLPAAHPTVAENSPGRSELCIFEWHCQRLVPAVEKAKQSNGRDYLNYLAFVPMAQWRRGALKCALLTALGVYPAAKPRSRAARFAIAKRVAALILPNRRDLVAIDAGYLCRAMPGKRFATTTTCGAAGD